MAYCNISICLFWSVKTAFCFCFLPSFCADKSKSIQIIIYYQSIIDLCLVSGKQFSTFLEKKNGENGKLNLRVRCAMTSQLMPSVNNNFLLISIVNIHHAFPPTTHFVTKTLKKVLFWNVIIGFNALVAIIFFNFPIVSTPNQNYVNRTTNSALITFKVEIQKKFSKKKKWFCVIKPIFVLAGGLQRHGYIINLNELIIFRKKRVSKKKNGFNSLFCALVDKFRALKFTYVLFGYSVIVWAILLSFTWHIFRCCFLSCLFSLVLKTDIAATYEQKTEKHY